ncbi:MAG: tRNA adenosine(34) deaminase TadA [Pseudomonadaceae bacterium]|nr:MAG: tRNA adenosine(34) deaminase TadA [Pseudomonadaceae bacterium]
MVYPLPAQVEDNDMTPADIDFMRVALEEARKGAAAGEVPVGAVLVRDGQIIGRGFNQPISAHDPSAHAEMVALRQAAAAQANYRLPGTTLYVTLEPCTMCSGLLVHSRIQRLVFGASEPRSGAVVSRSQTLQQPWLNHRIEVEGGVLAEECGAMLTEFFRARRG